jgi:hypothetical protein
MLGSGTHGLQSRTRFPPPRLVTSLELPARAASMAGRGTLLRDPIAAPSIGGWTMY